MALMSNQAPLASATDRVAALKALVAASVSEWDGDGMFQPQGSTNKWAAKSEASADAKAARAKAAKADLQGGDHSGIVTPMTNPTATIHPASEKQVAFLQRLVAQCFPGQDMSAHTANVIAQGSTRVSEAIKFLLARRDAAPAAAPVASAPAKRINRFLVASGRYALQVGDEVRFYVIGDQVQAQASDELHTLRKVENAQAVIDAIALDIQGAARLYGREIGQCCVCGRTLTSKWRKEGIGPVCFEKSGW